MTDWQAEARRRTKRAAATRLLQDGALLAWSQRAALGRLLSAKVLGVGGLAAAGFVLAPKALELYRRCFERRRGTLSLSYTLLYNRMAAHLNVIGFDPYQGLFHQVRHGHAALASDLIENSRPLIADALVLKLIRRKQLKPSDLSKEKGEYRLRAEASKIFFAEFEDKLSSRRAVAEQGGLNLTYAQIMLRQAHQLVCVVAGVERLYQPFTVK